MLELSNLRIVQDGEWAKLTVDVSHEGMSLDIPPEFWFAVRKEDAGMFAADVYDAFMIVPMYIAMACKTDLRIHGCVSKRLYKNLVDYFQKILCNFYYGFSPVKIIVDGFKDADVIYGGGGASSLPASPAGSTHSLPYTTGTFWRMTRTTN